MPACLNPSGAAWSADFNKSYVTAIMILVAVAAWNDDDDRRSSRSVAWTAFSTCLLRNDVGVGRRRILLMYAASIVWTRHRMDVVFGFLLSLAATRVFDNNQWHSAGTER